jgi:FG-GAP repeat
MLIATGLLLFAPQLVVTEQQKLRPSDLFKEDRFSWSIDIIEDRTVVGAPGHRHPILGQRTGAVYVFEKSGETWHEQMLLLPSNVGAAASKLWQYGQAVACDETHVIVGAPNASLPTLAGSGLAFVYVRAGVTWVEEGVLHPTDLADWFGQSVDIEGTTAIVGSGWPGTGATPPGAAYVFERGVSGWVEQIKLQSSDLVFGDRFGSSVIYRGNWAFVGAPRADGIETSAGAVYVFRRDGTEWSQSQKLVAANGRRGDEFGASLAFDGTTLVAGAPLHDEGRWINVGAAYVFQTQGSLWLEKQCLVPKGYFSEDHAGWSVAVHANRIAVGAPEGNWFKPGHVVLYAQTPRGWFEHRELSAVGAGPDEDFGRSVALDRSRLTVGAPLAINPWSQAGAGYVLDVSSEGDRPTYYCSAKQDSKGCLPRIFHIGQPSVSAPQTGATYEVGAWDMQAKKPGMLVYSTTGAASAPFAGGYLCVQAPLVRTPAQITPEIGLNPPCDGKFSFDFNAWIASGVDPSLVAGQPVWMQYWYRDPTGAPGNDVGLTQGIYVVIGP